MVLVSDGSLLRAGETGPQKLLKLENTKNT
jgi:hypothetical protein